MYDYKLSETAYAKMLFHAAKYPHLAVNGVLLAEKTTATTTSTTATTTNTTKSLGTIEIIDAMPLFHQCLHVTPMYEVALVQIDSYAEARNMVIAGYYCAHENFYHNGLDKAPAARIADKIYENNESACFVVIDNKLLTLKQQQPAVHFYAVHNETGGWTKAQFALQDKQSTLEAVSKLLQRGAMRDVIDFDMYLDNPKNDWTNKLLNTALEKLLGMY